MGSGGGWELWNAVTLWVGERKRRGGGEAVERSDIEGRRNEDEGGREAVERSDTVGIFVVGGWE